MFIVKPDGSVAVDNIDDAFTLSRRMTSPDAVESEHVRARRAAAVAELKSLPEAQRWQLFWRKCSRQQRLVLREIKTHPTVSIYELATVTERKPSSVGGIVSTIIRLARGFGYEQKDLFIRSDDYKGGMRRMRYSPGPTLEAADVMT